MKNYEQKYENYSKWNHTYIVKMVGTTFGERWFITNI